MFIWVWLIVCVKNVIQLQTKQDSLSSLQASEKEEKILNPVNRFDSYATAQNTNIVCYVLMRK